MGTKRSGKLYYGDSVLRYCIRVERDADGNYVSTLNYDGMLLEWFERHPLPKEQFTLLLDGKEEVRLLRAQLRAPLPAPPEATMTLIMVPMEDE